MAFFFSQFFFISLLTFYLQTLQDVPQIILIQKRFPHELAVHVGIMPAEPIVLGWRENSLVVQNGADAP